MNNYKMMKNRTFLSVLALTLFVAGNGIAAEQSQQQGLEEIIVTVQKRAQSAQETPIALSVMNAAQLEVQGITSLGAMSSGAIPSLHAVPFGSTPSNVVLSIRGNAPRDSGEVSREGSVAVYLDGVYIARSHGLGMELADLERVEVLRGPQGTLFGRNAIGGAVSLISKKPTGEFGITQTVGMGRFDELRSVTRINLPERAGIRAKLDYLHSERDGWVDNTAPGETDYNEYEKDGGRLSLSWQASEVLAVDYSYDQSKVVTAQNYFQFYEDRIGFFGRERERLTQTRLPVTPLDPTISETWGHTLTLSWEANDHLSFRSITAYRELEEDANNNYAGILYFNGLNDASILDQDQVSQEFQLIGTHNRIEWVAGLYYLEEDADKNLQDSFTLDIFNVFGNGFLSPIDPPTTFDALSSGTFLPPNIVNAEARSQAVYGQITWNPEILDNRFHLTLGGRYTEDEKSAIRTMGDRIATDQDSEHFDTTIVFDYYWRENFSTYLKWSTAYKAGGVNSRSASFAPFEEEVAKTFEVGLKSEFWERRIRLNMAAFLTDYEDMQLDFIDPVTVTILETINAQRTVEVDGLEVELTILPFSRLQVGLSYTYLDGDMPLQPNPLAGGALREFFIPLTPQHAGALTLDYQFAPWQFGTLMAHLDMTSTDHYSYAPFGEQRFDAYTLVNARLTLADIKFGQNTGSLKASIWGKNLADEEYVINAFPVGDPAVSIGQAFGDPRMLGVDITYDF